MVNNYFDQTCDKVIYFIFHLLSKFRDIQTDPMYSIQFKCTSETKSLQRETCFLSLFCCGLAGNFTVEQTKFCFPL